MISNSKRPVIYLKSAYLETILFWIFFFKWYAYKYIYF